MSNRHKFPKTHGLWQSHKAEHRCWQDLIQRCHNPSNASWSSYGGRGIYVCDRWRNSFVSFIQDMGRRPEGTSLDRINNDGPYSPENCRWATAKEQCNNHRGCIYIEFNGATRTIAQWAEITGINAKTLRSRYVKGWHVEEVFRPDKLRPVKARKDNESGLIGASKVRDKWKAQIKVNKEVRYLGVFDTAELAHAAYLDARAKLKERNT